MKKRVRSPEADKVSITFGFRLRRRQVVLPTQKTPGRPNEYRFQMMPDFQNIRLRFQIRGATRFVVSDFRRRPVEIAAGRQE